MNVTFRGGFGLAGDFGALWRTKTTREPRSTRIFAAAGARAGRGLAGAGGRWSRPDLELVEQGRSGGRDRVDRVAERLGVMPGWGTETADLTHVLQRGGVDILVGHPLGVRRAQGLDASAHASDGTWRFTPVRAVPPGRRSGRAGGSRCRGRRAAPPA